MSGARRPEGTVTALPDDIHSKENAVRGDEHEKAEEVIKLKGILDARKALACEAGRIRIEQQPPVTSSGVTKVVHFIRHCEGYHNQAMIDSTTPCTCDRDSLLPNWQNELLAKYWCPYMDDKYFDSRLNDMGKEQAHSICQPHIKSIMKGPHPPEVIITSSLRRATETARIAFDGYSVPIVASDLCREKSGLHVCDRRCPVSELRKLYPNVDYSQIPEEDPLWTENRENFEQCLARVYQFLGWIMTQRKERSLAVATHSAWLLHVFNGTETDENLRGYFRNGECRSVYVTLETEMNS